MVISPKNILTSLGVVIYTILTIVVIVRWDEPRFLNYSWIAGLWMAVSGVASTLFIIWFCIFLSTKDRWTKDIRKW